MIALPAAAARAADTNSTAATTNRTHTRSPHSNPMACPSSPPPPPRLHHSTPTTHMLPTVATRTTSTCGWRRRWHSSRASSHHHSEHWSTCMTASKQFGASVDKYDRVMTYSMKDAPCYRPDLRLCAIEHEWRSRNVWRRSRNCSAMAQPTKSRVEHSNERDVTTEAHMQIYRSAEKEMVYHYVCTCFLQLL